MEQISTQVNSKLLLTEYKNGIRFGTDALLLADFIGKHKRAVELGSGSGIISLLLLSAKKCEHITGIEIIPEYFELSLKNAAINGFENNFCCKNADVNDIKTILPAESVDCVFTNPPYLKKNNGKENADLLKFTAFHETTADIAAFLRAAAYLLKSGGKFYAIYRPEYLAKLITAMNCVGISPKRMRLVYPSEKLSPCLVLIEGKKHAHDGMKIEKPFFIYKNSEHKFFSDDIERIYRLFD
ncbi:MAG: methyltransferase domain-containing protein [Clostridia bacterium]